MIRVEGAVNPVSGTARAARLGFTISLSPCADEVTMKEMAKQNQQLRAGEILIIVVVLFMWAGQFHLFCLRG